MNGVDVIRRLHAHRVWVNEKLRESAEQLSMAQLHQEFEIGQGSVFKTLLHLYAAEYVWLAALEGDENPLTPGDVPDKLPGNQAGENSIDTLEELKKRWSELDARWRRYLGAITEASLGELVFKVSTSSGYGQRHETRRLDVLLHLCTHAQYTGAQAVNMMRHVGATALPDVMLITLAREEASR